MSKGPSTLLPSAKTRESVAYLTQDENDNIDVVVITATTYTGTQIDTFAFCFFGSVRQASGSEL